MISLSFVDRFDSEAWTIVSNELRNVFQTLPTGASAAFRAGTQSRVQNILLNLTSQRSSLFGWHRSNLFPVLEDSFASRQGLKSGGPRSAGRTQAGPFVLVVDDLVDAASHLPGVGSAAGD